MALISEYGFEEGTGTVAADSSGNGYNITVTASKWTSSGYNGGGLLGPDSTGTVALGPATLANRTVMCWAKMPASVTTVMTIICGITSFEPMYIDGAVSKAISRYDQANSIDVSGSTALVANTWYHLAWVTGSGGLKLYLNGVLDGSNATTVSYGLSSARLCNDSSNNPFPGTIDNLRVFDSGLTAAQIVVQMNTPAGSSMTPLMWVT